MPGGTASGYAVLFPGISVNRGQLRVLRDWRQHARAGRVLWVLSLAVATCGLATCITAGMVSPQPQACSSGCSWGST